MRVTIQFPNYNTRRFSRPWIAKVIDWKIGKPPVLEFGGLVGLTTEIEAAPGAIVRWGQRDNRGNHTQSCWGIVQRYGEVVEAEAEECREHWLAGCPAPRAEGDGTVIPFPGSAS
jgi:hypothetical protein